MKPKKKVFVHKICRKSDGLFSCGGHYPHFSKKGKVWSHVKIHLSQVEDTRAYHECELVKFEYREVSRERMEKYILLKEL